MIINGKTAQLMERHHYTISQLFADAANHDGSDTVGIERVRSTIEAFLFYRLESLPETQGRFQLNHGLFIPFDGLGRMEVDLLCQDARIAIEIDNMQHLASKDAYRNDRRKDILLQENGYTIIRFLAEDVSKQLDMVLNTIVRLLAMADRRT